MIDSNKKLNIGSGKTYIPGFINIDISNKADIVMDIGKEKLPFENNSIDVIFSYHTLEHIDDYLFALSEIYRVLKHNGLFLVGLPYVTLTKYHLINPYHLHNFNEYSFDFFDSSKMKGSAIEDNPILFKKAFHEFHYIGVFKYLPKLIKSWCRNHLLNVVQKIDFGLVAIKDINDSLVYDKDSIKKQFTYCLKSRILHK
tara:strand:+ start:396 stop:992 length:597 start_codon:yes stop_codon:yes gene_type:complete